MISFYNTSLNKVIAEDISLLEKQIAQLFDNKTQLDKDLSDYLLAPAKRLRPLLGFLFLRCVYGEITPAQRNVLLAVELIHNASLIHDDVVDSAQVRRNQVSINKKFDSNFAVVAGDFLLSIAMDKIIEAGSIDVLKLFTSALKNTCIGEINQYFSKFSVPTLDEYIQKSENKTALLFEIGILSGLKLSNNESKDLENAALNFSKNFGIAFQIRDDLKNFIDNSDINSDLESGIYTAPVVFATQANPNILDSQNLYQQVKLLKGIEKTTVLMDNYFESAVSAIDCLGENEYKSALIELIAQLKTNV